MRIWHLSPSPLSVRRSVRPSVTIATLTAARRYASQFPLRSDSTKRLCLKSRSSVCAHLDGDYEVCRGASEEASQQLERNEMRALLPVLMDF
jgi:hypothetical protein